MGRVILLVWAVLSIGNLFAQPDMILVKDINPDHDGKFSYSRVAMVNIKEKMGIQITPNPSSDFIMISMDANLNPATIRIFDQGGRLVFNKTQVVLSPIRISTSHLPKGWHVVETQRKNEKHTQRFFKQ